LSVSQTGVPVALMVSATAADMVRGKPVIVADQHAFAGVFTAHDVARDGVRDNAGVREREILRDNAPPPVGPKANRIHRD